MKTITDITKSSLTNTLLTGSLLALLTVPTLSMAGPQMQLASLENTFNSHVVFNDIAENYGDINDEEDEHASDDGDAKSDVISKSNTSFQVMIAMNDELDDTESSGYADNQDDG